MSKGGGGGGSTTVQKADPWAGLQPYLSQLYSQAGNWFNSSTPQYYPGQTVAGQAPETNQALAMGSQRAINGSPLIAGAKNYNQNEVAGNYLNSNPTNALYGNIGSGAQLYANPSNNQYNQIGSGAELYNNPSNPYFSSAQNGAYLNSNPSNSYFGNAAGGAYLGSNPYLNDMFNSATTPLVNQYKNAIAPGIASQFAAAGRLGSGSNIAAIQSAQNPLAQGLASAASSIYGGAYENERQRQQAAAGQLGQNQQFERGLQQAAAGQLGSNYTNAQQQRMQALAGLSGNYTNAQQAQLQALSGLSGNYNLERGLQQNAMQFAPQLANNDYADLEKLMGIGQYRQQTAQDLLNADISRYSFGQNQPLSKLQAFNQLLQGGSAYGTQSSQQNTQRPTNPFTSALGGAASVYGLGSVLGGGAGSALMGPWGALGGALLGGLFG